jgi:hypothetical protein
MAYAWNMDPYKDPYAAPVCERVIACYGCRRDRPTGPTTQAAGLNALVRTLVSLLPCR